MGERRFVLLCFLVYSFLIFNMCVMATDTATQRDALMATAEAYYSQGTQLQYDSFRKNLYATPEDATSQHTVYTVCSGFTFQTYYQTLGIEIPPNTEELLQYSARNKTDDNTILYYYASGEEKSPEDVLANKDEFFEYMKNTVKSGDIWVVTRTCYAYIL